MMKISWRFGIIAGIIVALFGLYPQFAVWSERGSNWNGVFASNDLDESAYASYLQALIDGRPRKNDPYSGRDETPENPQHESIFSIQFASPYLVAIPARILGLNASQSFIAIFAFASFFTALMLFWLIVQITGDNRFAFVATLVVMFGGALCSGNGFVNELLGRGGAYPFLPFLRRYIPSVAFPFFFGVFGFVWLSLKSDKRATKYISSIAAGLCFAFLVFSYFYIWTTAAAFLFALTVWWLILRPDNWKENFKYLLVADLIAFLSLLPYAYLLSKRAPDIDDIQLLVYTHAPDFFRYPLIICAIALGFLALAIYLGYAKFKENSTIFFLAFSTVPVIVFNQQVITGRSLQPFHYEFYVVNYIAGLVFVLAVFLFVKNLQLRQIYAVVLLLAGLTSVIWGYFEVKSTTKYLMYWNIQRDEAMPVASELAKIAENKLDAHKEVTLNYDYVQADNQPTVSPQAVLWARHQHVFAGVTWEENKERFYQRIYYLGRDADWLREDFDKDDIEAFMALFGWDRFNARLSVDAKPLKKWEIEEEVQRYDQYAKNFSYKQAANPTLSYAIFPAESKVDLTNLTRWYEIGEGENFGKYTLYKLELRSPK